jgi:AraC-like DNA-binding protein
MLASGQEPNTSRVRESDDHLPRAGGNQTRLHLDQQRLHEIVLTCGYDAHRISRHLGISVRHLQRWFSTHMACTPCVWLVEQRLQRARYLLGASSSVKEVAYSLGFKQLSQFSRDFKRRFGHQPSIELAQARVHGPALAQSMPHSEPALPVGSEQQGHSARRAS